MSFLFSQSIHSLIFGSSEILDFMRGNGVASSHLTNQRRCIDFPTIKLTISQVLAKHKHYGFTGEVLDFIINYDTCLPCLPTGRR